MASIPQHAFVPDYVPPPGTSVAEVLEDMGMSQVELALRTGKSEKAISQIVGGDVGITPDTALQLERALGHPASFWLNLNRLYEEHLSRERDKERLRSRIEWLKNVPVTEMIGKGFIRKCADQLGQLQEVLRFFGLSHPDQWPEVRERAAARFRLSKSFEPDEFAVSAWLRQGFLLAHQVDCRPYNAAEFRAVLLSIRALTLKQPEAFVPELIQRCATCGVAVAFVPELRHTHVSGAARWLDPSRALIQLSLRYRSDDMLWFAFFHECYHVLYGKKLTTFLDNFSTGSDEEEDIRADRFAEDILIPSGAYEDLPKGRYELSEANIRKFARQIGISPGIVVGRLQHDGHLPATHLNGLKQRYRWSSI